MTHADVEASSVECTSGRGKARGNCCRSHIQLLLPLSQLMFHAHRSNSQTHSSSTRTWCVAADGKLLQRTAAAQLLRQAAEASGQPQQPQLLQLAQAGRGLCQALQGKAGEGPAALCLEVMLW